MKTFESLTICVIGTYSSKNLGDQIMQKGCAIGLRKTFPNAKISILTPNIKSDSKIYGPVFDDTLKSHRKNPFRMLFSVIFASFWPSGASTIVPFSNDLTEIHKSDLVVFTNGDMFTEDYGSLVALTHFFPMLLALNLGKKYVFLGQSIGKFRILKGLAKQILNKSDGVYLREDESYSYLKTLDPKLVSKMERVGDLAFLAHKASGMHHSNKTGVNGIEAKDKDAVLIGVSVSNLFLDHLQKQKGLTYDHALEIMIEALSKLKSKLGVEYIYVPHVMTRGSRNDLPLLNKIQSRIGGTVHEIENSEQASLLFKRCQLTICSRMHANIASLAAGTETIALSYSHKSVGLLQDFDLADNVLLPEDFSSENLESKVADILTKEADQRNRILELSAKEEDLAWLGFEKIRSLLE